MDQNGQSVQIANGMICTWLVDMFGGPVPPQNKWYKIPDELLHSGMVVAYVNFVEFLEQNFNATVIAREAVAAQQNYALRWRHSPEPRPDERPLITPQFREENEAEWDRLWHSRPDECPVCHEKPDIWDGPMNSDVPTRCTHWACTECWDQVTDRDQRCPICRDDLSVWLRREYQ